jgi:HD-like signal output (HDOD) protein
MGLFDTFKKVALPKSAAPVGATANVNLDRSEDALAATAISGGLKDKHLLFVGLPANRVQTLQVDLGQIQPQWDCQFVSHVEQAVKALASGVFRTIISSSGVAADVALLTAIEKQSGQTIRVVLCESGDRVEMSKWSASGATPLLNNIDAAGLAGVITRISRVQEWMSDAGMKKLLTQCHKLPAVPELYSQITAELSSPHGSIDVVAHFIAKDPIITAKVLQVVNSAIFALDHEVSDPAEAVMFLGLGRVHSLVLLAGAFTQFENVACPGFSPDRIWNHSLQVATLAQIIALEETNKSKIAEAAFTSGLMHDMGKLILAANVPVMCAVIDQLHQGKKLTQRESELQVLGTTHAELAACLLGTWGLPLPVLEAVAWHHCPSRSRDTGFTPLTAVHAANVFAYEMGCGPGTEALPENFDHNYLLKIGLGECRNKWRESCGLEPRQDEDAEYKRVRLRRDAKIN